MIGSANCAYETPCGWCSKWDKKCDRKIGTATQISTKQYEDTYLSVLQVDKIETHLTDSATSISSKPKRCGSCDKQTECVIPQTLHRSNV